MVPVRQEWERVTAPQLLRLEGRAPVGLGDRTVFEDLGNGTTRLYAQSLVDSFEGRDAWLASGMETGVNDGYTTRPTPRRRLNDAMTTKPITVEDYEATLPDQPREILAEVRRIIAEAVPGVTESIRYQMPVFSIDGMYLVYAGAWKKHLGLYPIPTLPNDLEARIAPYRTKVDTVRFLYNQPIPYDLISELIEALVPIRRTENQ